MYYYVVLYLSNHIHEFVCYNQRKSWRRRQHLAWLKMNVFPLKNNIYLNNHSNLRQLIVFLNNFIGNCSFSVSVVFDLILGQLLTGTFEVFMTTLKLLTKCWNSSPSAEKAPPRVDSQDIALSISRHSWAILVILSFLKKELNE